MAFVTYKLTDGGRQVDGVYRTQALADAAAQASSAITAQQGKVNDAVETGDYINAAGHILGKTPNIASVRDAQQARQLQGDIADAHQAGMRLLLLGDWRATIRNDAANRNAAFRYAYHQAALGWLTADSTLFASLSRSDRFDLVEHIVKQLRIDLYAWFGKSVTTSDRNSWAAVAVADNSPIFADLVTAAGVARDPDGTAVNLAATISAARIPANFVDTLTGGG